VIGVTRVSSGSSYQVCRSAAPGAAERVTGRAARDRVASGAELWTLLRGQTPPFTRWIYSNSVPVITARQGRLELPADVVALEDSLTYLAARGQSLGSRALLRVATAQHATGRRVIITKILVGNRPAERYVERAGFRAVARVHFVCRGPLRSAHVTPCDGTGGLLAEQMERARA
jgi:hypothetical protein